MPTHHFREHMLDFADSIYSVITSVMKRSSIDKCWNNDNDGMISIWALKDEYQLHHTHTHTFTLVTYNDYKRYIRYMVNAIW